LTTHQLDERRIKALEAELAQVRDDRARLCEVILRNPCRQALEKLVEFVRQIFGPKYDSHEAMSRAFKALRDTEGQ
jgi:hypothetical protein